MLLAFFLAFCYLERCQLGNRFVVEDQVLQSEVQSTQIDGCVSIEDCALLERVQLNATGEAGRVNYKFRDEDRGNIKG